MHRIDALGAQVSQRGRHVVRERSNVCRVRDERRPETQRVLHAERGEGEWHDALPFRDLRGLGREIALPLHECLRHRERVLGLPRAGGDELLAVGRCLERVQEHRQAQQT